LKVGSLINSYRIDCQFALADRERHISKMKNSLPQNESNQNQIIFRFIKNNTSGVILFEHFS